MIRTVVAALAASALMLSLAACGEDGPASASAEAEAEADLYFNEASMTALDACVERLSTALDMAREGTHSPETAIDTDVVCSVAVEAVNEQYPPDPVPDDDVEDWATAGISRASAYLAASNTQGGASEGGSLSEDRLVEIEEAIMGVEFAMEQPYDHDHTTHTHADEE